MTLKETFEKIKNISASQPNVHYFTDEFDNLNREDTQYTAIVCQNREHTYEEGAYRYNFYLGYVDRLDSSKENKIDIYSEGINSLMNICRILNEDSDVDEISISQFVTLTQKFTAECACVYATISIVSVTDTCGYQY